MSILRKSACWVPSTSPEIEALFVLTLGFRFESLVSQNHYSRPLPSPPSPFLLIVRRYAHFDNSRLYAAKDMPQGARDSVREGSRRRSMQFQTCDPLNRNLMASRNRGGGLVENQLTAES
ncbi:hypothetical protein BT93_C0664 [Corymbia citriodora subsp. variegata]|nr:hypothetical protein BT93_C0664 [Corymbia citriodora subsp. variegata]